MKSKIFHKTIAANLSDFIETAPPCIDKLIDILSKDMERQGRGSFPNVYAIIKNFLFHDSKFKGEGYYRATDLRAEHARLSELEERLLSTDSNIQTAALKEVEGKKGSETLASLTEKINDQRGQFYKDFKAALKTFLETHTDNQDHTKTYVRALLCLLDYSLTDPSDIQPTDIDKFLRSFNEQEFVDLFAFLDAIGLFTISDYDVIAIKKEFCNVFGLTDTGNQEIYRTILIILDHFKRISKVTFEVEDPDTLSGGTLGGPTINISRAPENASEQEIAARIGFADKHRDSFIKICSEFDEMLADSTYNDTYCRRLNQAIKYMQDQIIATLCSRGAPMDASFTDPSGTQNVVVSPSRSLVHTSKPGSTSLPFLGRARSIDEIKNGISEFFPELAPQLLKIGDPTEWAETLTDITNAKIHALIDTIPREGLTIEVEVEEDKTTSIQLNIDTIRCCLEHLDLKKLYELLEPIEHSAKAAIKNLETELISMIENGIYITSHLLSEKPTKDNGPILLAFGMAYDHFSEKTIPSTINSYTDLFIAFAISLLPKEIQTKLKATPLKIDFREWDVPDDFGSELDKRRTLDSYQFVQALNDLLNLASQAATARVNQSELKLIGHDLETEHVLGEIDQKKAQIARAQGRAEATATADEEQKGFVADLESALSGPNPNFTISPEDTVIILEKNPDLGADELQRQVDAFNQAQKVGPTDLDDSAFIDRTGTSIKFLEQLLQFKIETLSFRHTDIAACLEQAKRALQAKSPVSKASAAASGTTDTMSDIGLIAEITKLAKNTKFIEGPTDPNFEITVEDGHHIDDALHARLSLSHTDSEDRQAIVDEISGFNTHQLSDNKTYKPSNMNAVLLQIYSALTKKPDLEFSFNLPSLTACANKPNTSANTTPPPDTTDRNWDTPKARKQGGYFGMAVSAQGIHGFDDGEFDTFQHFAVTTNNLGSKKASSTSPGRDSSSLERNLREEAQEKKTNAQASRQAAQDYGKKALERLSSPKGQGGSAKKKKSPTKRGNHTPSPVAAAWSGNPIKGPADISIQNQTKYLILTALKKDAHIAEQSAKKQLDGFGWQECILAQDQNQEEQTLTVTLNGNKNTALKHGEVLIPQLSTGKVYAIPISQITTLIGEDKWKSQTRETDPDFGATKTQRTTFTLTIHRTIDDLLINCPKAQEYTT